jgi:hypothetical protein
MEVEIQLFLNNEKGKLAFGCCSRSEYIITYTTYTTYTDKRGVGRNNA